jgi:hypothetical protein
VNLKHGENYSSEAELDKLESTYVHGVPSPMNANLNIVRFSELAERGLQNEWEVI